MKTLLPAVAALFGLFASVPAHATTLVELSLEQLSQASTEIVRGRAIAQEARWNSSHTTILTLTTIEIEQTFKGAPRRTVVIEQPGGALGNIRVRVPGTVSFRPRGSYYLFLEPAGAGASGYRLVGMAQGAYRVYRLPQTNKERVISPIGGLFYRRQGRRSGSPPPAPTFSTGEFQRKISAALAAPLVIPGRTSIPVAIRSTENRGASDIRVSARSTAAVYPSSRVVVPAGSLFEGSARLVSGKWKIRWSEVSIRGARAEIKASSEEPAGETLQGRVLMVNVR